MAIGEIADGMTSQDALMVVYLSNLTRTQISIAESRLQNQQQSDNEDVQTTLTDPNSHFP